MEKNDLNSLWKYHYITPYKKNYFFLNIYFSLYHNISGLSLKRGFGGYNGLGGLGGFGGFEGIGGFDGFSGFGGFVF